MRERINMQGGGQKRGVSAEFLAPRGSDLSRRVSRVMGVVDVCIQGVRPCPLELVDVHARRK